jgi:glycosyltransferase involved in cell wall biosynthesis
LYGVPYVAGLRLRSKIAITDVRRRNGSRPVITHFHGPWSDESAVAGGQMSLGVRAKRLLEQWGLRQANYVIVLSQEFRRVAIATGAREAAVHIVPPGVDAIWFERPSSSGANDEADVIRLVCVRRLTARMGHVALLDALLEMDFRIGHQVIHLDIVGRGVEYQNIAAWLTDHDRHSNVTLHGYLVDAQVRSLLRNATVAVVPTLELEGFGLVVLEAMASGTPVVTTGQGGLSEAMGPWARKPFIFNLDDPESLLQAITAALSLNDVVRRISEIGGVE